jgi:hypothetical protein
MEKPKTADDSFDFWAQFEEAEREVASWPDWKQAIQVGIYSYSGKQKVTPPRRPVRRRKK